MIIDAQSFATKHAADTQSRVSSAEETQSDYDTFLEMLTVQVQNQDPLNPLDSTDFAVQLATFSSVEQQVETNNLLTSLVSASQTSDFLSLSHLLGKQALVEGPAFFDGEPVRASWTLPLGQTSTGLSIRNSVGEEVFATSLNPGQESYSWDGRTASGEDAMHGEYSITISTLDAEGVTTTLDAHSYVAIREVRNEDSGIAIILGSGETIGQSDILALSD